MNGPIHPGFDWDCAFDFEAGFFQPGDRARAEFRRGPADAALLAAVDHSAGASIENDRLRIHLTGEQTLSMRPDTVVTNFVIERGGREIAIGVLVTIKVTVMPTRPRA